MLSIAFQLISWYATDISVMPNTSNLMNLDIQTIIEWVLLSDMDFNLKNYILLIQKKV